jgi:hypothetical protein
MIHDHTHTGRPQDLSTVHKSCEALTAVGLSGPHNCDPTLCLPTPVWSHAHQVATGPVKSTHHTTGGHRSCQEYTPQVATGPVKSTHHKSTHHRWRQVLSRVHTTGGHRSCQEYTRVHKSTQEYTRVHKSTQEYTPQAHNCGPSSMVTRDPLCFSLLLGVTRWLLHRSSVL